MDLVHVCIIKKMKVKTYNMKRTSRAQLKLYLVVILLGNCYNLR
jgi:hypothetical protein